MAFTHVIALRTGILFLPVLIHFAGDVMTPRGIHKLHCLKILIPCVGWQIPSAVVGIPFSATPETLGLLVAITMSLEQFISSYGYAAIVVGTFFEGETILVLGGFAAHQGYLQLPWVLVSAFLGTLLGDQFYFYIGRSKAQTTIEKRTNWKYKSERVFLLLRKHEILLILSFRFLYGVRTITPFVLGASRIRPIRFLVLNIIGAVTWSIVIGVMGYMFGHALETVIGDIKRYELWLFAGLAALGVTIWSVHLFSKKRAGHRTPVKPKE